MSGTLVFWY